MEAVGLIRVEADPVADVRVEGGIVGEVSDLVQTRYGFHIIKLIDKKEGKTKNFEEVKKDLENKLITKRRKDSFDSLVAGLKSKAKITINEDLLKQGSSEMPQSHPEIK